jgi:hypothetical protein
MWVSLATAESAASVWPIFALPASFRVSGRALGRGLRRGANRVGARRKLSPSSISHICRSREMGWYEYEVTFDSAALQVF